MSEPREMERKNHAGPESTAEKMRRLYELIDGIEVALLTTRRPDGRLVSRPMATQNRAPGADLWFVTSTETMKLEEIEDEPQVNVAYYDAKSREWVSISGTAHVSRDPGLVGRLWREDWKAYFPKDAQKHRGGPDDPRIALIGVDAESVTYMTSDVSKAGAFFEIARASVTGDAPRLGKIHEISPEELGRGPGAGEYYPDRR